MAARFASVSMKDSTEVVIPVDKIDYWYQPRKPMQHWLTFVYCKGVRYYSKRKTRQIAAQLLKDGGVDSLVDIS